MAQRGMLWSSQVLPNCDGLEITSDPEDLVHMIFHHENRNLYETHYNFLVPHQQQQQHPLTFPNMWGSAAESNFHYPSMIPSSESQIYPNHEITSRNRGPIAHNSSLGGMETLHNRHNHREVNQHTRHGVVHQRAQEGNNNNPHLRIHSVDEVAILEIQSYSGVHQTVPEVSNNPHLRIHSEDNPAGITESRNTINQHRTILNRNRRHRRVQQTAPEYNNSHSRIILADEVAMLEFPGLTDVRNTINQHRSMPDINRPNHHRRRVHQIAQQHNNNSRIRILPEQEVIISEIRSDIESRNSFIQHMNMPLDTDNMPYEELLALGESIGTIKTGLSEEAILSNLKTRIHVASEMSSHLNESTEVDEETEICIICQAEYENQEKIGILDCGHEYHADCIKQWLLEKNVCPVCKRPALTDRKTRLNYN